MSTAAAPNPQDAQRRLVALAATAVLVVAAVVTVTTDLDIIGRGLTTRTPAEQLVDGLLDLGGAAGEAMTLGLPTATSTELLAGRALGAGIADPAPLPVTGPGTGTDTGADPGGGGSTLPVRGTTGLGGTRGADTGDQHGLTTALRELTALPALGVDPATVTAALDDVAGAAGTRLGVLAAQDDGAEELATATRTLAGAVAGLEDALEQLEASAAALGTGPDATYVLTATIVRAERRLAATNDALGAHADALRALRVGSAQADGSAGPDATGDDRVDAAAVTLLAAATEQLDARMTAAERAAVTSAVTLQEQVAALAWGVEGTARLAASALQAGDGTALAAAVTQAVAEAGDAGATVTEALDAALLDASALAAAPETAGDRLCTVLGCAPPAGTAGTARTTTTTGGDLRSLQAAADTDGDGDVDGADAAGLPASAAAVVRTVAHAADVDGDGDADALDAALLVTRTPLADLDGALAARAAALATQLGALLGDDDLTVAGGPVGAAAAFLVTSDSDGDGRPDGDGLTASYGTIATADSSDQLLGTLTTARTAAVAALDRDGDGAVGPDDEGCASPTVGRYVTADGDEAALATEDVDPTRMQGLTLLQLARTCVLQAGDGEEADPTALLTLTGAVRDLIAQLAPGCDGDAARCDDALVAAAAAATEHARAALEAGAGALVAALDVDGDGQVDSADADPFEDGDVRAAYEQLLAVFGDTTGAATPEALVTAVLDTLPTTHDHLVVAELLGDVGGGLLEAYDLAGDGRVGLDDAAAAGPAARRLLAGGDPTDDGADAGGDAAVPSPQEAADHLTTIALPPSDGLADALTAVDDVVVDVLEAGGTESLETLLGGGLDDLLGGDTELLDELTDPVEDVTDPIDDVTDPIDDVTDPIEDVTDPIDDVTDPIEDVTDPIDDVTDPIEDVTDPIDDVTDPVEDVTDPLDGLP